MMMYLLNLAYLLSERRKGEGFIENHFREKCVKEMWTTTFLAKVAAFLSCLVLPCLAPIRIAIAKVESDFCKGRQRPNRQIFYN